MQKIFTGHVKTSWNIQSSLEEIWHRAFTLKTLRNICAITRQIEGMNNYEHMKKKLSHKRNGHYERSKETN